MSFFEFLREVTGSLILALPRPWLVTVPLSVFALQSRSSSAITFWAVFLCQKQGGSLKLFWLASTWWNDPIWWIFWKLGWSWNHQVQPNRTPTWVPFRFSRGYHEISRCAWNRLEMFLATPTADGDHLGVLDDECPSHISADVYRSMIFPA